MDLMSFFSFLAAGIHFTVFGVPVTFTFGAFGLLLILITASRDYIRKQWKSGAKHALITASIISGLAIMVSIALHELCHGLVAYAFGIKIVRSGFMFWGAYVAWDPSSATVTDSMRFLISLAGPSANIIVYALCAAFVRLLSESMTENTIQCVAWANLQLWKINLLPVYGLDGGNMFNSVLLMVFTPGLSAVISIAVTVVVVSHFIFRKKKRLFLEKELERL